MVSPLQQLPHGQALYQMGNPGIGILGRFGIPIAQQAADHVAAFGQRGDHDGSAAQRILPQGAAEKALNRLLITRGANRAMLDVRPLFATSPGTHPGLQHAQSEKPRVPLHVLSTGDCPLVRFIGHLDTDLNDRCFTPWIERLALWTNQGKTPYPMVHTPDNRGALELAIERLIG